MQAGALFFPNQACLKGFLLSIKECVQVARPSGSQRLVSEIDQINKIEVDETPKPTVEDTNTATPDPDGGRPKNARDKQKRKQKRVLPRSKGDVSTTLWAYEAQKDISELVMPMALAHFNKKNARSLTKSEFDQLEYLKLCILTGVKPFIDIDADVIKAIIDSGTKPSGDFKNDIETSIASF